MGKSKRTPEVAAKICAALRSGNTRVTSAITAGISSSTFFDWINDDPELLEQVKKAEEDAVARNVAVIQKAAITSWQAAAWWLERRRPDDFRMAKAGLTPAEIEVMLMAITGILEEALTNEQDRARAIRRLSGLVHQPNR